MKKLIFILILALGVSACHTHKDTAASKSGTHTTGTASGGNGQSVEEAIVINETTETEGVAAEYAWLRVHYPGYKLLQQSLIHEDGKPYDKMEIKTVDGDKKTIYFDISHFFGKF